MAVPDPWPQRLPDSRAISTPGRPIAASTFSCSPSHPYIKGYHSSFWLTFKQARDRGGNIKKGEKASLVVFWKQYEVKDKETGELKTIPILKYYNCFNVDQSEGIPAPDAPKFTPTPFNPNEACEAIVKGYKDGPVIEHTGSQAYYKPSIDTVRIPDPTRFEKNEDYYSTILHELSHSTGAKSDSIADSTPILSRSDRPTTEGGVGG